MTTNLKTRTMTVRATLSRTATAGALVVAGLALGVGLEAPAASSAATTARPPGSLVYIKGYDVYVARPDGTGERRLTTDGTAALPYVSPTGDDLGHVVAARGPLIHRLSLTGTPLGAFDPPDLFDTWGTARYGGTVTKAAVSPDGSKIAFTYQDFHCVFNACRDYWVTGVAGADGSGPTFEDGVSPDDNPSWVSGSRLIGNGAASEGIRLFDRGGPSQDWFHDGEFPRYVSLTEPVVSRDATMLATTRGTGSESRIVTYEILDDVVHGSFLGAPATVCQTPAAAGQGSPAFAPDGSAIAWRQSGGIWVKPEPLGCAAEAKLVVDGATDVSWSKAELPSPSDPDTKPGNKPGTDPGTTPGHVAGQHVVVLTAAPKLVGKGRVGKLLKVRGGTWSPSRTTLDYRWLRGGKPIKKATKAAYRITAKDRGKRLSVRLTSSSPGMASATWTSRPVKVRR